MAKNVGIKLYAWNCKKVIFSNNGADQYPGQNEEGLSVTGEKWYKSGNFYNQNPDMSKITVPMFDTGDCFFFNNFIFWTSGSDSDEDKAYIGLGYALYYLFNPERS